MPRRQSFLRAHDKESWKRYGSRDYKINKHILRSIYIYIFFKVFEGGGGGGGGVGGGARG